jgi:signal transduction histidine kinase
MKLQAQGPYLVIVIRNVRVWYGWVWGALSLALARGQTEDPRPDRRRKVRGIEVAMIRDIIAAFLLFLMTANNAVEGTEQPALLPLVAVTVSAPLVLRDRWPLGAWRILMGGLAFGAITIDYRPIAAWGPAIVAVFCLYTIAVRCDRQITFGVWLASLLFGLILSPDDGRFPFVVYFLIVVTVPLLLGFNVRARRAAQRDLVVQEQETEQERAARGLLEERSRIARELHDVVAHHMSVIAIQAEAAPLAAPGLPESVTAAFTDIRATALDALTEMRHILGVLRSENVETAPQPSLDQLDELIAGVPGLIVSTEVYGIPRPLPATVSLSAYRIAQEALSNAMRHAPGSNVRIELTYGADLSVRVVNGPPDRPVEELPGGGHGLVGMRERAVMLGGEFSAEPTIAGGFIVTASLPLRDAS